ncbi:MAG: peptidylprolyl isomerase [Bacteroidota bacterium]
MRGRQVAFFVLTSFAVAAFTFRSCESELKDVAVAQVGSRTISLADFESLYLKSNSSFEKAMSSTIEDRERFLDLLVNYQLKVEEAYELGYDKNPKIVEELQQYRQSLATSYVVEQEITKPAIDLLYERRKEEIRARHILIAVAENASPEDTLKAYGRTMDIIRRLQAGESFVELARAFSADSATGKGRGGDLYYFSSGTMVAPFEDACYRLRPGEMTQLPIRTRFGYHTIQVIDREPNPGSVRVSHIYVRLRQNNPPADTLAAYQKMAAILDSIQTHGKDFAEMATRHSEDRRSAAQGGDIGFIARRSMVPVLDSVAFSLHAGEISSIIRSPLGFHLLTVTEKKPLPTKKELEPQLRRIFQQQRFAGDYEKHLNQLKGEYGYRFHEDQFAYFLSKLDTNKTPSDSAWAAAFTSEDKKRVLVEFRPTEVSLSDFVNTVSSRQEFLETPLREKNLQQALDRVVEMTLMDIKGKGFERTNGTFRKTMQEFKDGTLLFEVEQAEIWGKLKVTEDRLRAYFERHQDRFQFPQRVEFTEVFTPRKKTADSLYAALRKGTAVFDSLTARYLRPAVRKTRGKWELQPAQENDLTRKTVNLGIGGISEPISYQGGYSIIRLDKKEPPRLKTYEEAVSEVASAYRDREAKRLERQWLDRLRQKYPVTVYKDRLSLAFAPGEVKQ